MLKPRGILRLLSILALPVLFCGVLAAAQARTAAPPAAPMAAPALNDKDVAATQSELIRLLRLSPTLTTVVSHDPSLLSNQDYVTRNNPQLGCISLAAIPRSRVIPSSISSRICTAMASRTRPSNAPSGPTSTVRRTPSPFGRFLPRPVPAARVCRIPRCPHLDDPRVPREPPLGPHLQIAD